MGNRKNKRLKKTRTPKKKQTEEEVEEEQFLREVTNKEVSEERIEEAEQLLEEVPEEEEQNQMEEAEQGQMEEAEQGQMEEQRRKSRLVLLSSYLGPLVREHVPVIIDNWRKVTEDIITVLCKYIKMRFDVDEEFKKDALFKQMGEDKYAFKVVSDAYRERRQKQIPHTCGRKGMVRLREDLVKASEDPSKVSRLRVWVKSRTKKDGTPVNVNAAEKIRKASEIELEGREDSSSTNPKQDLITEILGPDQPGRLRAMSRDINTSKLNCLQIKNSFMAAMEEKHVSLEKQVYDLQQQIARMNNQGQETDVSENSNNKSVNTKLLPKCYLVDWSAVDVNVAEGRVVSSEPYELVNGIPLEPNAVKSPFSSSNNKCKLMDYVHNEEVVAVGRWQTKEPKTLVNGLPLGPNAIKVYVDESSTEGSPVTPPAPTKQPAATMRAKSPVIPASPLRRSERNKFKPNKKIKLLDLSGNNVVVVEGRWSSSNPEHLVHFQPLGPVACRVFVDVLKVKDAAVWRTSSDIEYMEDALGSSLA
ncbi:hypothetical protein Bca4012_020434 [Brassica carinata]